MKSSEQNGRLLNKSAILLRRFHQKLEKQVIDLIVRSGFKNLALCKNWEDFFRHFFQGWSSTVQLHIRGVLLKPDMRQAGTYLEY